jgi:hypothetical protein
MALETLNLDNLGELDSGQARGIVDAAIRSAIMDLEDRGGEDEKERKVTITLILEKIGDGIAATVEASVKVPAYKTGKTVAKLTFDGSTPINGRAVPVIKFRPGSPRNPDQKTFDDVEDA